MGGLQRDNLIIQRKMGYGYSYKRSKLKIFLIVIAIILIICLSFIIVVGGPAAIDKSVEKLTEYKDSTYNKVTKVLGIQKTNADTLTVINDISKSPFDINDKNVVKVKLEIVDNMMYIRPKINGIEMRFLLDTGCYDIHLTPAEVFFMEHQGLFNSKTAVGIEKRIYADGKEHECPTYILNSVELGGIKIDSVKCTVDYNGGSSNDSPLLGQKVLRQFGDIIINYSDSTLIIKKKNSR